MLSVLKLILLNNFKIQLSIYYETIYKRGLLYNYYVTRPVEQHSRFEPVVALSSTGILTPVAIQKSYNW